MISESDIEKMKNEVLDRCKKRDENSWIVVNKQQGMFGDAYLFTIHHSKGQETYIVEENPFLGLHWRHIG